MKVTPRRIQIRDYAFVTKSQLGRPPAGKTSGPWVEAEGCEPGTREYRQFRKRTQKQSRWYRRNQREIEERRRSGLTHVGKGIDWARLYPYSKHRILAWREVS